MVDAYTASLAVDRRIAMEDVRGSIAHARMLGARGIIPSEDATAIIDGLEKIQGEIAAGRFDRIVHGIPDGYRLCDGDILSVDCGAIVEGYHGDAAVTVPVGEIEEADRLLIGATERAVWAGIDKCRPGNRLSDIGHAVEQVAAVGGYGVVREYVGHGIGTRMHEEPQVPNYGRPGRGLRLDAGLVLAIEPMLNRGGAETDVLDDHWTVVTRDGSRSAHFEHTVAITEHGPEVLTLLDGRVQSEWLPEAMAR